MGAREPNPQLAEVERVGLVCDARDGDQHGDF